MSAGQAARVLTSLFAVVVVCLLALGLDSASSQSFGSEVNVSQSPGTDSEEFISWQPRDSGTSDPARGFVAWLETDYGDDPDDPDDPSGGVDVCELVDPMEPPRECTSLPEAPGNAAFLSAAGAGDSRFVAWEQYTSDIYSGEVRIAHSMDAGEMWSSPETIATNAYRPRIVAHENRVFAGYLDWNTGAAMVREGTQAGNGISWGVPVTIATGMWRMDLFMDGDGTLVIFTGGASQVQVNTVEAIESLPGSSQVIGNGGGASAFDLDYLYEEGVLVPLFIYTDFLSQHLYVVCLGVDDWGEPVLVAVNAGGVANPGIAASGAGAYVVWDAWAIDRSLVRGRGVGCDEGQPVLGQPQQLSDGESNSFQPQVTINGPRVYVAYNESPVGDDDNVDVRLLGGRLIDGSIQAPHQFDLTGTAASAHDFVAFMLVLAHANVNPGVASQGGGVDDEGAPFLHFFYYQVDADGQSDIFWRLGLITGDTDCDAGVDAVDALQVLRETAGLPTGAGCLPAGDVNCDGVRTSVDVLFILRYVAALPVTQPDDCSPIDL